nr:hypothetical protein JVH1_4691 [Rhodococcus sp. JVH1]
MPIVIVRTYPAVARCGDLSMPFLLFDAVLVLLGLLLRPTVGRLV